MSNVDKEKVKPTLISRLKSNLAEELSKQQIDELVDLLLDLTLLSLSHTANKLGDDRIAQQHQIAREFWNLVNWLDQSTTRTR